MSKRRTFSINFKLSVLNRLDTADEDGKLPSLRSIAKKIDVTPSSIRLWKREKDTYLAKQKPAAPVVAIPLKKSNTRKTFTIDYKLSIVNKLESVDADGKHPSLRSVAKAIGVSPASLRLWQREKDKYLSILRSDPISAGKTRKVGCGKRPSYPEIDQALYVWLEEQHKLENPVKEKDLQAKALALGQTMNHHEFKASAGYLDRFKTRYQASLRMKNVVEKTTVVYTM